MAERPGPAPVKLYRRLESVVEGEPIDQVIWSMGMIIGQMIAYLDLPATAQEEVIEACVRAIRLGIRGPLTEH